MHLGLSRNRFAYCDTPKGACDNLQPSNTPKDGPPKPTCPSNVRRIYHRLRCKSVHRPNTQEMCPRPSSPFIARAPGIPDPGWTGTPSWRCTMAGMPCHDTVCASKEKGPTFCAEFSLGAGTQHLAISERTFECLQDMYGLSTCPMAFSFSFLGISICTMPWNATRYLSVFFRTPWTPWNHPGLLTHLSKGMHFSKCR